MTRSTTFSIGEFYHIYNRGTDKRKVFLTKYDYERFVALLYLSNTDDHTRINMSRKSLSELLQTNCSKSLVDIGAYCLMPNHFHILVHEKVENGLSRFMQKLTTGYTMYFNKKHDRTGALFQGVFKAQHADRDEYLKYMFSYIHLNPIKLIDTSWKEVGIKNINKAKSFLESYSYSSYQEYTKNNRMEENILNKNVFPDYFESDGDFQNFLEFWLKFKDESFNKQ